MRFFAEINSAHIIVQVIAISDTDANNGCQFCHDLLGGEWLETSVDGTIRKQYPSIGYTYDADADEFVAPSPYSSWVLDANNDWQAPTPKPEGDFYWDEESLSWLAIPVG